LTLTWSSRPVFYGFSPKFTAAASQLDCSQPGEIRIAQGAHDSRAACYFSLEERVDDACDVSRVGRGDARGLDRDRAAARARRRLPYAGTEGRARDEPAGRPRRVQA